MSGELGAALSGFGGRGPDEIRPLRGDGGRRFGPDEIRLPAAILRQALNLEPPASDDSIMGNDRGYVHLRTRDGDRSMARVVGEHDATLHLSPGPGGSVLPSRPEPVEVGWMTWSGMVWCGGLVLREKGFGDSIRVRLLGRPVATERRRHVRLPVDLDVEVIPGGHDPSPVRGKCVDLSPGGMQVILPVELDVGDVVRIALSADDGNSLETTARVARRIGPARFGFAFSLIVVGSPERFSRFALDQATRLARASAA